MHVAEYQNSLSPVHTPVWVYLTSSQSRHCSSLVPGLSQRSDQFSRLLRRLDLIWLIMSVSERHNVTVSTHMTYKYHRHIATSKPRSLTCSCALTVINYRTSEVTLSEDERLKRVVFIATTTNNAQCCVVCDDGAVWQQAFTGLMMSVSQYKQQCDNAATISDLSTLTAVVFCRSIA